jgi:riboflavin biosynthesis pyrimidine reductase
VGTLGFSRATRCMPTTLVTEPSPGVRGAPRPAAFEPADQRAQHRRRFVMGLLRACADAVLIGADDDCATPPGRSGRPTQAYPPAAALFDELRHAAQAAPTAGGRRPQRARHGRSPAPGVRGGRARADERDRRGPLARASLSAGSDDPHPIGPDASLDPAAALDACASRGHRLVLCEGGTEERSGRLVAAGLVDELFLTTAPRFWRAARTNGSRPALVEGYRASSGQRRSVASCSRSVARGHTSSTAIGVSRPKRRVAS